jgi:YVTN family beta-propeller protein
MKRRTLFICLGFLAASNLAASSRALASDDHLAGKILIANRGSGTLSIIAASTDQVIDTVELPACGNPPEPMYVVYVPQYHRVFVGDRANQRVVVFDADDFSLIDTVPAGQGVFHMWAHPWGQQLWVANDIDNTATVIHTKTLRVITTVPMPADLVAQGGKPHDVILDQEAAYITMVGLAGANDYVVKFDRHTFLEVARAAVGKDPHVALTRRNTHLYVASQNSHVVQVLQRRNLAVVTSIAVPGAHGVWIPESGKTLYVTNLPGGGSDGLFTIDLATHTVLGNAVDTAFPVPHNLVATADGRKLYMTHSGATANQVTVYAIARRAPIPVPVGAITVESNPFGLAFVPDVHPYDAVQRHDLTLFLQSLL